jgi:ribosomal protein S18 acetylase RimI-like enzyme
MEIRAKKNGDAKEIIAVAKSLPKWFTKDGVRQIGYAAKRQHGFMATEGNRIIGFVFYRKWKRTAYLTWIGVLSSKRRKGIGSKLLAALETSLKKYGMQSVKVSTLARTEKYKPYEETRFFYEKNGFMLLRIDKDFYPKSGDREVLIKKLS